MFAAVTNYSVDRLIAESLRGTFSVIAAIADHFFFSAIN